MPTLWTRMICLQSDFASNIYWWSYSSHLFQLPHFTHECDAVWLGWRMYNSGWWHLAPSRYEIDHSNHWKDSSSTSAVCCPVLHHRRSQKPWRHTHVCQRICERGKAKLGWCQRASAFVAGRWDWSLAFGTKLWIQCGGCFAHYPSTVCQNTANAAQCTNSNTNYKWSATLCWEIHQEISKLSATASLIHNAQVITTANGVAC